MYYKSAVAHPTDTFSTLVPLQCHEDPTCPGPCILAPLAQTRTNAAGPRRSKGWRFRPAFGTATMLRAGAARASSTRATFAARYLSAVHEAWRKPPANLNAHQELKCNIPVSRTAKYQD